MSQKFQSRLGCLWFGQDGSQGHIRPKAGLGATSKVAPLHSWHIGARWQEAVVPPSPRGPPAGLSLGCRLTPKCDQRERACGTRGCDLRWKSPPPSHPVLSLGGESPRSAHIQGQRTSVPPLPFKVAESLQMSLKSRQQPRWSPEEA